VDTRPQLERTARRALLGAGLLIVGSTLLGAGLSGALIVWLTTPKEKSC
jgi:hypothetical protein